MTGLEGAGRGHHQAGEQPISKSFTIDAEIGRLADPDVVPGRAFDAGELPRPDMRLLVALDHEAALLDFGNRVRRRRLDPVDLTGQQRRSTGIGLRHRQQHHLVDLGHARLVPVGGVLDQFEPLARREGGPSSRTGAGSILGERGPGRLRFRLVRRRPRRHQTAFAISPETP